MLRLGEGWSAEKLSQKYGTSGSGSLARTTIAKIESNLRPIKVGEVEGVARVFDLTSNDLLAKNGPSVVLSYADQDRVVGREVDDWLTSRGFRVTPLGPERAIDAAQAFIVLLSPSFLSASRCQDELALAMRHQQQLARVGSQKDFIYILRVAGTADVDDSALEPYPLVDLELASDWTKEVALSKLGSRILAGPRAAAGEAEPQAHSQSGPGFLDRGEELDRLLYGLGSPAGPHFWLVLGPPGLGKSSFLAHLAQQAGALAPGNWDISMLNLSEDDVGREDDAMGVILSLFEIDQPPSADPDNDLVAIAQKIMHTGKPHLYLLDSAELLSERTVTELRGHLGRIYTLIQDKGGGARLAFVAASRLDDGWKGVRPYPEPVLLPLGEFTPRIVQVALENLASRMPGVRSPAELRQDALLVQRITEGVPGLVQDSLRWIEAEQWVEINRLNKEPLFEQIISPYIKNQLLTLDSLLPEEKTQPEKPQKFAALEDAFRVLVPYRFFTLSHVNHSQDNDSAFLDRLKKAHWTVDNLWQVIAGTALLYRPLNEPWHEIHPAIRRLLYRYFYPGDDQQALAHEKARDFTALWAGKLTGKDQVIGMVESIWHEAARLRLGGATAVEEELIAFTEELSRSVRPDPYTGTELREYAAQRMQNDDELQREVASFEGLFDRLVQSFLAPGPQEA